MNTEIFIENDISNEYFILLKLTLAK